MARLKKIKPSKTGLSSIMANVIIVAITIAIVIAASLWAGGLINFFNRHEEIKINNSYIINRSGKLVYIIKYENVGPGLTIVDSVLLNGVPYTSYTPIPELGGDLSSLPSACETGITKEGTITFEPDATDPNGNRLSTGVTLEVTITTKHGHKFIASTVIPSGGSQSSITQEDSETNSSVNSPSSEQTINLVNVSDGTRFRLGATVPSSSLRRFGDRHGVTIDLDYVGGQTFYNYMTQGPGYFAHIDLAMGLPGIWDWGGLKQFLKGMLDSADADGGRCEISITLFGVDLGWTGFWESSLLEVLSTVGPNRPSMRYVFLAGEWSYKNRMPPTYDEFKMDFMKAKEMVANYGYELGWQGEGKYLSNLPKDVWSDVISWGPRTRGGQLSTNPDPVRGVQEAYNTGFTQPASTDVFLNCFTMWDTPANLPNTTPYYITYEKLDSFLKGASDRFKLLNGTYPQSVTFDVMPETFNDVEGVDCPYLQWWMEMAQKYDLKTSQTPPTPVERPPDVPVQPSQFPPYPTLIKWVNLRENLPPFQVQAGGTFQGAIYTRNLQLWSPLSNKEVEIYLVKQTLKVGPFPWSSYPITKEEWVNRIPVGKVFTKTDGWALNITLKAPLEPGRYTVVARITPTSQEIEGISDFMEFILVTPIVHKVEIRSNVSVRYSFGPSEYGPPWQGVDPGGESGPNKPMWGRCGEGNWTFIFPYETKDQFGNIWEFFHWEDGGINPIREVYVDKDIVMVAYYRIKP